jgi:hypothetical protein
MITRLLILYTWHKESTLTQHQQDQGGRSGPGQSQGRAAQRESSMAHIYQIIVQGHLDTDWSEELEGLTITHRSDGTSLLSGPLVDQSALHGLLLKVRDLGLTLLSFTRLDAQELDGPACTQTLIRVEHSRKKGTGP